MRLESLNKTVFFQDLIERLESLNKIVFIVLLSKTTMNLILHDGGSFLISQRNTTSAGQQ